MATSSESLYLPSLDKVLNGDLLLISWEDAYHALLQNGDSMNAPTHSLEQFFSDTIVLDLLAHPSNAFPAPSQQSKIAFETRTSAINVTPSSNSRHDIKEVREDALWLSKEAEIDEVAALRIVLEECQGRHALQLLCSLSNEELANIQQLSGITQSSSALTLDFGPKIENFSSRKSRRVRILQTLLSERRAILQCLSIILQKTVSAQSDTSGPGTQVTAAWLAKIGSHFIESSEFVDPWISESILTIETIANKLNAGCGWLEDDVAERKDMETAWLNNQLSEISYMMEVVFLLIGSQPGLPSSTVVLGWLKLVDQFNFFEDFPTENPITESLFLPIKSVVALISLLIISPCTSMAMLGTAEHDAQVSHDAPAGSAYIANLDTIVQMHAIILRASEFSNAAPMVLAWAEVLQALMVRNASKELEFDPSQPVELQDVYQETADIILHGDSDVNVVQYLATMAVDQGQVFQYLTDLCLQLGGTSSSYFSAYIGTEMRLAVINLMNISINAVGYVPELVETFLAALTGGRGYWEILDSSFMDPGSELLLTLAGDTKLYGRLILSAKLRYPWESALLKLIRALVTCHGESGSLGLGILTSMTTFTGILSDRFTGFTTTQEEENNNLIRLTAPLPLFEDRAAMRESSLALARLDPAFVIPSGTLGRMISEANPRVAHWFHPYPGLQYLKIVLESFTASSEVFEATTGGKADRDSVADIIEIFAGLLLNIAERESKDEVEVVIGGAYSEFSNQRDTATIIFDIFEEELQLQSTSHGSEASLDVLISCVHFVHAILRFFPNRVWPLIGRCGLLELGRGRGRLSTIVGNVEIPSGRFDLLLACSRLFEGLVGDFVTNAVRRLGEMRPSRFSKAEEASRSIPRQILSNTLLSTTRYFVDVLESSCTWKYADYNDRRKLGKTIINTFNRILCYAYGINSQSKPEEEVKPASSTRFSSTVEPQGEPDEPDMGLMAAILPSAAHILDSFLSASSGSLRFQPLLESLVDGFQTPRSTTYINAWALCKDQVSAILSFSATLLKVGTLLDRTQSQFEAQLFKSSPLISRLYAVDHEYQVPVLTLFEALIVSASRATGEPPSLLGYLGSQTSKNLLYILSDLDKPLCDLGRIVTIWQFLATVISNRQQWFANYLLTGKSAKSALKSTQSEIDTDTLDRPVLVTALDALSDISDLPKPEALSMLNFVALAQNFWPWATYNSAKHMKFMKSISEYVGKLPPIQPSLLLDDWIETCYQTKIAAHVAELLAMHLFHSRQTGSVISTKDMLPNLSFFTRVAVSHCNYNFSLHANLKRNFENRYKGCSLLNFERTTVEQRPLGLEYFYNTAIMDEALYYDKGWQRLKGFRDEVVLANVNLSLVDAQIALLHGWSFLASELSKDVLNQPDLQKVLAKTSLDCLMSNRKDQGPQEIFRRLDQRRAELALVLVQRLIESKTSKKSMEGLLPAVWETIRNSDTSFGRALDDGQVDYHRTLLKLLFLSLRVHAENNEDFSPKGSTRLRDSPAVTTIVVELLEQIVANGMRDLAVYIHDQPAKANPEDIELVTGILQACLRIPGIEFCYTRIAHMFSANDTPRIALTLYSWSDKFAINGDPVYGELGLLFLLELSTMPSMAEQLAIDGVLGKIGSANITAYLHRGNVSPFADSAGGQRCYNIWVRGILPLLLNLLDAVGDLIGSEIALFINQFPKLLQQSSEAFDAPETSRTAPKGSTKHITFSTCSEVHSIALITFILNGYKSAGAEISEVKWDAANVLEAVEFWLTARNVLRDRILPMGSRDMALKKQVEKDSDFGSRLEERIISELLGIRDVLAGK